MSNESAKEKPEDQRPEAEKPCVTLPATVEKVIPTVHPSEPEKAQIVIEGADDLYREIRVANTLQDGNGKEVSMKQGAQVEVTIEADAGATTPKEPPKLRASG